MAAIAEPAGEKRFPATPKKRKDARKKGQVLKSPEISSAVVLIGLVMILRFWLPSMIMSMSEIIVSTMQITEEWTAAQISALMLSLTWRAAVMLLPLFGAAMVLGLLINYAQVGVLFTTKTLKFKWEKFNIAKGLKKVFGLKAVMNLVKSLLKFGVVGYFLYAVVRDNFRVFPAMHNMTVLQAAATLGGIIFDMAWKVGLAFLFVAFIDFLYQWFEYEKELRMTLQEIKDEFKQTEGDPHLKAEIKKKQRAMAQRRMMEELKTADVVITNPAHVAVALKYDPGALDAPQVVAKGQDLMARRIREVAREHDITMFENKELARALYAQVDLGELVPANLYQAVAEVLAFVYKLAKRRSGVRPVLS
ncbi:MAG: flagellar biosynthesis protein FlhB [Peptococcaceae bacterium]|nr:flagellar biosynthesis protein FlhB [Peptococcaceae bacterium]